MEANELVARLKADGSTNCVQDLKKVFHEYKNVISTLSSKDRSCFAVNILCVLCGNLEKVPQWSSRVDSKDLVSLTLECVKETRTLGPSEQSKVLACVYYIHKHAVKQCAKIPSEMIMRLAYSPFEMDLENEMKCFVKTYWNLMADRITYIATLKAKKADIIKLLTKLTEDILRIINIFDTVQFCCNGLLYLVKKLFYLYNDVNAKHLNATYKAIFEKLNSKNDLQNFKRLSKEAAQDLYVKFSDMFCVIVENSMKINFKDSVFDLAVNTCKLLLRHHSDIYHCLQTFYLNSLCNILTDKVDLNFIECNVNGVLIACETTEKLGYKDVMMKTYPYLGQILRLLIEYTIKDSDKNQLPAHFDVDVQEKCLSLMQLLMTKLRKTEQMTKCDNCEVKTGLHDAFRLSLYAKHFVTVSLDRHIDVTNILPNYFAIIEEQCKVVDELFNVGCCNHDKYLKKAQTDIHNAAILLNKHSSYEYSIKIFDLYLRNEIQHYRTEADNKNISRGFYNKSICEMDYKLYENGLQSAYLSFLFAQPDAHDIEKHLSVVIDIKAKLLKENSGEDKKESEIKDHLQLMTVLNACEKAIQTNHYENLKPFFCNLKFSLLLKHEFSMYAKLWPSILPICGVWIALDSLSEKRHGDWLRREIERDILWTLYDIILETPTVVRSIHNEYCAKIVRKQLENLEPKSAKDVILRAILLFLKCEYDLAEAGEKYSWKMKGNSADIEKAFVTRSIVQEHAAMEGAIEAVQLLTEHLPLLMTLSDGALVERTLTISELSVWLLLHMSRPAHALQLAHICCQLAERAPHTVSYVRNAGVILQHARSSHQVLDTLAVNAKGHALELLKRPDTEETAVVFLCDLAMFRRATGSSHAAARLVQLVQNRLLQASEDSPLNGLAIGRLLEAQTALGPARELTGLVASTAAQRHYLALANTGGEWSARRRFSLQLKVHIAACSAASVKRWRSLLLRRRAGSAALVAYAACSAAQLAGLEAGLVCTHRGDEAQMKINERLKVYLGIETVNGTQHQLDDNKQILSTPKLEQVESMRDSKMFHLNQTSPTLVRDTVARFKMPEFITHPANCQCYACQMPLVSILACQTLGLEASMYFRMRQLDIAMNYFDGVLGMLGLVEAKLKQVSRTYKESKFEGYIAHIVEKIYKYQFESVQIDILKEAALYEHSSGHHWRADDHIVRIYEIMDESDEIDGDVKLEVMNLVFASAKLRKASRNLRRNDLADLETELEKLNLSPAPKSNMDPPKTPEIKAQRPPNVTANPVKVADDELPTKRRVIKMGKLNLEEEIEEEPPVPEPKPVTFKIPVPRTVKPVPETITPRPSRKPKIIVEQSSEDEVKPIDKTLEFSTPHAGNISSAFFTPREEFFTPMSTPVTSDKKTLRTKVVKNLDLEYEMPKNTENKENLVSKPQIDKDKKAVKKSLLKTPRKVKICGNVETAAAGTLKEETTLKPTTSSGNPEEKNMNTQNKRSIKCAKSQGMLENKVSTQDGRTLRRPTRTAQPNQVKPEDKKISTKDRKLKRATSPGKLE